jgi:hypothetical protein
MVAAAIGIGSAAANLGGSLISSNAAGNAAELQSKALAQNLAFQSNLIRGGITTTNEMRDQLVRVADQTRDTARTDITGFGDAALKALYGGGQNAYNALVGYAPMAVGDIRAGADRAINYLTGSAAEARGNTGSAIDAIRGGVNRGIDYLGGAAGEARGNAGAAIDAIRGGTDRGTNYLLGAAGDVRGALQPFINTGQGAAGTMADEIRGGQLGAMPSLTDFSQLPGYQFTLGQGQQAARNAASASGYGGLGAEGSGPLGKALVQYSEGLANTFGSQYLQNYWANQNNRYNILANTANMGLQAGGALSSNLANIYGNIGNLQSTGAANQAGVYSNLNTLLANIAANQGNLSATGGANEAAQQQALNTLLANIAANQGNISATAGANTGQVWSNLGNAVANQQSTLAANAGNLISGMGSNLANLGLASGQMMSDAYAKPLTILANLAAGAGTNYSNASTQGSANIAQSVQNQGNLLGAGIAGGVNSGMSNYLLYNALNPAQTAAQTNAAAGWNAAGTNTLPY